MRKNDRSRPNNRCVVNVQLDPHRAELFYRMKNAAGATVSECLKMILNPILDRFENALKEEEKKQAEKIMGIVAEEDGKKEGENG